MATSKLSPCKTERWAKTKLKMRLCSMSLLAVTILASLPYISSLTLPSGDPAPGRSPGPPVTELPELDIANQSDVTTEYVTTEVTELGACAFARVPSESETVVTVSEVDSEVNLTVGHAVFETDQLVRGVVYDVIVRAGHSEEDFDLEVDDIFSSVLGPVFDLRTPHPIPNNTRTIKPWAYNIAALNARLLKPRALTTPKLNHTVLRRFNIRAPMPYLKNLENQAPKMLLAPQGKLQLDMLLQEAIPGTPDFNEDIFEVTTRRFNEIHAEHQKWMQDSPSNDSRRRYPYGPSKDSRRQNPGFELFRRRVRMYNQNRLQNIREKYKLQNGYIPFDLVTFATQLYFKDREALKRSLALMAQFIYGAQYKFLYAQLLKDRYGPKLKYRIGYSFAVLENLKLQFYAGYYAMLKYHKTDVVFEFDDEVMYLIKLYERLLRVQVEFNDIVAFVVNLDYLRKGEEEKRKEKANIRDLVHG